MTDIVAFLTARLDEQEQSARDAEADWTPTAPDLARGTHLVYGLERVGFGINYQIFASEWEPPRVLAEVAAKRRVLARHHPAEPRQMWMAPEWRTVCACVGCGLDHDGDPNIEVIDDCPELRDLAAIYADYPDFDESWRP